MAMAAQVTLSQPVSSNTAFILFTLIGDYVVPRGGTAWTRDLLYLLRLLGVNERAARTTLHRMTQRGWLGSHKDGRHSKYSPTRRGLAILRQGERRIFEPPVTEWDGIWHFVVYSLPESRREQRRALRTNLRWLGYGHLAPGTWISPHDRSEEVVSLVGELEVCPYVKIFSGSYLWPSSEQDLVTNCWDLQALESDYRDFVARYRPEYEAFIAQDEAERRAAAEHCFVRRFWVTHDFQSFPRRDPNLPVRLLPAGWPGFEARRLVEEYRRALAPYANDFLDRTLNGRKEGDRREAVIAK